MVSRGGCSKIRQHLSIFSTDGKGVKNNGRVEDVGEGILPLSQCENSEKVRSKKTESTGGEIGTGLLIHTLK